MCILGKIYEKLSVKNLIWFNYVYEVTKITLIDILNNAMQLQLAMFSCCL